MFNRVAAGVAPIVFALKNAEGVFPSLPARNERGESRREGKLIKSASPRGDQRSGQSEIRHGIVRLPLQHDRIDGADDQTPVQATVY